MRTPNIVKGASLEVQFSANPVAKRELVLGAQVAKSISENQNQGTNGKEQKPKRDTVH